MLIHLFHIFALPWYDAFFFRILVLHHDCPIVCRYDFATFFAALFFPGVLPSRPIVCRY